VAPQPSGGLPAENHWRGSNHFKAPSVQDDSDDSDACVIVKEVRFGPGAHNHAPPVAAHGDAARRPVYGGGRGAAFTGGPNGVNSAGVGRGPGAGGPSRSDALHSGNGAERAAQKRVGSKTASNGAGKGDQVPRRRDDEERDESPDVEILEGPQMRKDWEAAKQTKRKNREEKAAPGPRAHPEGEEAGGSGRANGVAHGGASSAFKRGRTDAHGSAPGPSSPGVGRGGQKISFASVVRERAGTGVKGSRGAQEGGDGGQKRKAEGEGDGRGKQQKVPVGRPETVADLRARMQGPANRHAGVGGSGNAKGPTVMQGLFSSGGIGLRPVIPKGSQAPTVPNLWKRRKEAEPERKDEGARAAASSAHLHVSADNPPGTKVPADTAVPEEAPATARKEDPTDGRDQEVPQRADLSRVRVDQSGTGPASDAAGTSASAGASSPLKKEGANGPEFEANEGQVTEFTARKRAEALPSEDGAPKEVLPEDGDGGGHSPLSLRESLKQSEAFQTADAAEWEQRQVAIAKQV
jgi:hypothetical protein